MLVSMFQLGNERNSPEQSYTRIGLRPEVRYLTSNPAVGKISYCLLRYELIRVVLPLDIGPSTVIVRETSMIFLIMNKVII